MNTKIIRKSISFLMVMAIMFSTLATPITNIGKVIVQATEESEIITDEIPTDQVDTEVTNTTETAPIVSNEEKNASETSETNTPIEVTTSIEPTPAYADETTEATSSLEVPSVTTCNGNADEPHFEGATQITENGELVNKIGLEYSKSITNDFNSKYTITEVRLVQDEINAGDDAAKVEKMTLVGPITNPTLLEFDPSKDSVYPQNADTYTAIWN